MKSHLAGLFVVVALGCAQTAVTRASWEAGGRQETLEYFRENIYGRAPLGRPADETFGTNWVAFADGKIRLDFEVRLPPGASAEHPVPVFVFGDFYSIRPELKPLPVPVDEMLRRGYAFVRYDFNQIAPDLKVDDQKWTNGVFAVYGGYDRPDGWGKVAAWAWGFSRVVDWIETRPELDAKRVMVFGHSRGGKTALWAGAEDPRIALSISNNGGVGGAHLNRMKTPGVEVVDDFIRAKSYNFFCPNFLKLRGHETELEHDADDLLRLIAPRRVYLSSGSLDRGAGPEGVFESARLASTLWNDYGLKGISLKSYPTAPAVDHSGSIGYHLSTDGHRPREWDFLRMLDYADRHLKR